MPSVTPEYLALYGSIFEYLSWPWLPCSLPSTKTFGPPNWVKILPSLMWPQAIFLLPHWSDFLCLSPDKGWHPKGSMEKAPTEFMRVDLQRQKYLSHSEGSTNKFVGVQKIQLEKNVDSIPNLWMILTSIEGHLQYIGRILLPQA